MQIIGGMYPSEPTAELLERTEAYLASLPEDAAALYRQIAEARGRRGSCAEGSGG